jgi:hypothetical protein
MNLINAINELKNNPVVNPAITCRVQLILRTLPEDESKALELAIEGEDINARALANLLKEHKLQISVDSIRRHRRRKNKTVDGCLCP